MGRALTSITPVSTARTLSSGSWWPLMADEVLSVSPASAGTHGAVDCGKPGTISEAHPVIRHFRLDVVLGIEDNGEGCIA
jgi:hypothetical protein